MSKLNPNKKSAPKTTTGKLAGVAGATVARQDAEALLRRSVMACLLWEDLFYESAKDNSETISELIKQVSPDKVAQIAIEARRDQKLRHVPLFIASEMLKHPEHKAYVQEVLPAIITRADQLTDFMAIYWKGGKTPLASQAKKGLAKAFHNFNEFSFAKYDRNANIKLRDVMRMVHPKPRNQAESVLFSKIRDRSLMTPDTWEVALSSGADKKETWERLITEGKLGALAFLRNLRNMKEVKVDHNIIREGFANVRSSMLLPLNFLSAARYAPEFKGDIEKLMLRTYADLPKLPGYTIFIVDISGSMNSAISGKSNFNRYDAASAMAMLAVNQCEKVDLYCTAGNDGSRKHATDIIRYPEKGFGLFDQIKAMNRSLGGGGIFTRQALDYIKPLTKETPDRIIVFSDSQDIDYAYGNKTLPDTFGVNNYIVDVSAHKHGINYKGVWTAEISGWSEKFLTYIAALEGLQNTFVDEQ